MADSTLTAQFGWSTRGRSLCYELCHLGTVSQFSQPQARSHRGKGHRKATFDRDPVDPPLSHLWHQLQTSLDMRHQSMICLYRVPNYWIAEERHLFLGRKQNICSNLLHFNRMKWRSRHMPRISIRDSLWNRQLTAPNPRTCPRPRQRSCSFRCNFFANELNPAEILPPGARLSCSEDLGWTRSFQWGATRGTSWAALKAVQWISGTARLFAWGRHWKRRLCPGCRP